MNAEIIFMVLFFESLPSFFVQFCFNINFFYIFSRLFLIFQEVNGLIVIQHFSTLPEYSELSIQHVTFTFFYDLKCLLTFTHIHTLMGQTAT